MRILSIVDRKYLTKALSSCTPKCTLANRDIRSHTPLSAAQLHYNVRVLSDSTTVLFHRRMQLSLHHIANVHGLYKILIRYPLSMRPFHKQTQLLDLQNTAVLDQTEQSNDGRSDHDGSTS
jgi:hypothetical protein